jgi:hypothetical protein
MDKSQGIPGFHSKGANIVDQETKHPQQVQKPPALVSPVQRRVISGGVSVLFLQTPTAAHDLEGNGKPWSQNYESTEIHLVSRRREIRFIVLAVGRTRWSTDHSIVQSNKDVAWIHVEMEDFVLMHM